MLDNRGEINELMRRAEDCAKQPDHIVRLVLLPGLPFDMRVLFTDNAARGRLRGQLVSQPIVGITWQDDGDHLMASGANAHAEATFSDRAVFIRAAPDRDTANVDWADSAATWNDRRDIQVRMLLRPKDPAAYARAMRIEEQTNRQMGMMDLWMEGTRLRMEATAAAVNPSLAATYANGPSLSFANWSRVPPLALIAGACALHADDVTTNTLITSMVVGALMPMKMANKIDAALVKTLLDAVDGAHDELVGYVEQSGSCPR